MTTGAPASRSALTGVRVLALETSLSGPHCTKLLADLGAEVIKIERPGVGDVVRGWDSAVKGLSSGYVFANGNKKSLASDLTAATRSFARPTRASSTARFRVTGRTARTAT